MEVFLNFEKNYSSGSVGIISAQYKPQVRTIFNAQSKRYHLAFPHMIFFLKYYYKYGFEFSDLFLGIGNKPFESLKDILCYAPFPNCYELKVCPADIMYRSHANVEDLLKNTISAFWQSHFVFSHGNNGRVRYKPIKNLASWQENTAIDPNFISRIKWASFGSIFNLVEYVLGGTIFPQII